MQLPITKEKLKEFEKFLSKKENSVISEERIAHAEAVAELMNYAYYRGRSEIKNE